MNKTNFRYISSNRKKLLDIALLCLVGLLVNLLISNLVIWLKIPLYLDNIGVLLTAAIGGYIPGIVVGYLSNIINSIGNPMTAYYGTITVLNALVAAWFVRHGWFKKVSTVLLSILVFAFFGGILGSLLTMALYGFNFADGMSGPVVRFVYEHLIHQTFWAQLMGDFLLDIIDKAITVCIVLIVLKIIPDRLVGILEFSAWRQKPLTKKEEAAVRTRASHGRSLSFRITLVFSLAMMIIAIAITGISFMLFRNTIIEDRTKMGQGLVNIVRRVVKPEKIDEYMNQGKSAEGYAAVETELINLRESSESIQYVYIYKIMEDGCHVVFDPDTAELAGEKPGTVIPVEDAFKPYMPDLLAGRRIDPIISNDTYGWLLTIYEPLYDSEDNCVAYVGVDVDMGDLRQAQNGFMARVLSLFLGFFVMILAIVLQMLKYDLILPVNTITAAAENFAFNSEKIRKESVHHIKDIDIRTGDEIESLYHAFTRTSEDMVRYVEDVQEKNETISRMQNRLIEVMADMVESRDKYTGDHVRKTAAYAEIILKELKKEGVYEDQLTDEFISDVVHSAPLHDIGKIQVSDTILNKPGKLTDEEFAIMKNHTLAGNEIIARATDAVADPGYLKEARNLAAYHHEKWNGKGYPYGISGEDIPLSARIMAVADVFDALVSKRSYKEGFPVEKAFAIIMEGSGSHFDAKIVTAFMNAEDEVRRVAEPYSKSEVQPVVDTSGEKEQK